MDMWSTQGVQSDTEVIKLFSCSSQLSMKIIMLMNVKIPSIVGILTFTSMIKTTSESLKARNAFIFQHISYAPNFDNVEGAYCFWLVRACVCPSVCPFKIYLDTVLKFHIGIPHQKLIDVYFF